MIEVFKTNVRSIRKAKLIIQKLGEEFPAHKINFDLNDWRQNFKCAGKKYFAKRSNQCCNGIEFSM